MDLPAGAIYSLFNKVSFLKIQLIREMCWPSQKCSRVCKMDVNVVTHQNHPSVSDAENGYESSSD